ncbi:hypothetical protein NBRC116585_04180 [Thalassolituus maritimus]|uniref:Uncharacterized protein n=1 Tax=Thalassolituus maritimus TaxID=484498 RepID=A0ABP9ZVY4_9GAMM
MIADQTKKAANAAFFVSGKNRKGTGVYEWYMSIPKQFLTQYQQAQHAEIRILGRLACHIAPLAVQSAT